MTLPDSVLVGSFSTMCDLAQAQKGHGRTTAVTLDTDG